MYLEKCHVLKVLCISTSACVYLNWQQPSPNSCTEPSAQPCRLLSPSAQQRAAEQPWCILQRCKTLWVHSSGHPFLPVSTPKSSYPFSSPLGNELVTSEAPSPDASFVPGKQQLSHYQAWSFERLVKEGIKRNPVTLCLSLISRKPKPSTHLSQPLPLLCHWFAVCKGIHRQTSPRLQCLHIRPKALVNKPTRTSMKLPSLSSSSENKPVNKPISTSASSLRVLSVQCTKRRHCGSWKCRVWFCCASTNSQWHQTRYTAEKQDPLRLPLNTGISLLPSKDPTPTVDL